MFRFSRPTSKLLVVLGACLLGLLSLLILHKSQVIRYDYLNDVLIYNSSGIDGESMVRDVENRIPSLPIAYWLKNKQEKTIGPKYPSIFDLQFNNMYWQTLRTSNGTFQLFGAYYDVRKVSSIGPAIRILGMIDRNDPNVTTFCQLWFDGQKEPVIVKTFEYKLIWERAWGKYNQGVYQPYLIACQIPKQFDGIVPASVSIVEKESDTATNNLRVIYNRPPDDKKKGFAVCVKGLDFLYEDLSVRLVEWIEMLNILGAEKMYLYELQVHPNIRRVLQHYEQEGLVHVTPLTLPGDQPNAPGFQHMYLKENMPRKRQNELIPYNDCLYKNMYMYDYLALLDIDEVIFPKIDQTWHELMARVLVQARNEKNITYASFNLRNVHFWDEHENDSTYKDIPKYMHMLQHVHRAQNYSAKGHAIKCFHDTEHVLTLHNHFPFACLTQSCPTFEITTEDAQLQHYRPETPKKNGDDINGNTIEDTTIWKYKDELIRRSVRTFEKLGFFSKNPV